MKMRSIDECILITVGFSNQPILIRDVWRITKKVLHNEYSSNFNFYRATRYSCEKLSKKGLIKIDSAGCSITLEGLNLAEDIVKDCARARAFTEFQVL